MKCEMEVVPYDAFEAYVMRMKYWVVATQPCFMMFYVHFYLGR